MTSFLRGDWGWGGGMVRQKWDVIGRRGCGVSECSGRPILHHAKPNINILLTRNIPFDSDVRQRSHPLMIPLHYLWAKSNNRTLGQFECDVWLVFVFDFVRSHARWGCCSIVCLHFQVVQIKQVDCKMSTNNLNNHK